MIKEGDRVRIKKYNIKGKVVYIDYPTLFHSFFYPIQVLLDKDYDESGHRMIRTSIPDLKVIKPSKKWERMKKRNERTRRKKNNKN